MNFKSSRVNGVLLWLICRFVKTIHLVSFQNDRLNDPSCTLNSEFEWEILTDTVDFVLFHRGQIFLYRSNSITVVSCAFRMEACKSLRWYVFYKCFFSNDTRGFSSFLSPRMTKTKLLEWRNFCFILPFLFFFLDLCCTARWMNKAKLKLYASYFFSSFFYQTLQSLFAWNFSRLLFFATTYNASLEAVRTFDERLSIFLIKRWFKCRIKFS